MNESLCKALKNCIQNIACSQCRVRAHRCSHKLKTSTTATTTKTTKTFTQRYSSNGDLSMYTDCRRGLEDNSHLYNFIVARAHTHTYTTLDIVDRRQIRQCVNYILFIYLFITKLGKELEYGKINVKQYSRLPGGRELKSFHGYLLL